MSDIVPGERPRGEPDPSSVSGNPDAAGYAEGAGFNPGGLEMNAPLKPARNPRWEAKPGQPPAPDEAFGQASHQTPGEPDDLQVIDSDFEDSDVALILSEIQAVTAVAQLESQVDEIEHTLARMASAHDQDASRLTGELAIMKARIEDALSAVSATVDELRGARTDTTTHQQNAANQADADELKGEIRAGLAEAIEAARSEAAARLRQIRSEVDATVASARAEFQSSFTGLLKGFETGLQQAREQTLQEVTRLKERVEPELKTLREEQTDVSVALRRDLIATEDTFSGALRAFATRLEGLQSQIAESAGRQAAERASLGAQAHGLSVRIDGLEERMAEGLARLSEGILRIAENLGSATTLQRRIAALEAKLPG